MNYECSLHYSSETMKKLEALEQDVALLVPKHYQQIAEAFKD